jgi:hypothetical protein
MAEPDGLGLGLELDALVQVAAKPDLPPLLSEWNLTSIVGPDVTSAGVEMPETPSSKTVELVEVPS